MGFLIYSRLCTFGSTSMFQTIRILNFALGSWGNWGPSLMFHIYQLTDTIKIGIKSDFQNSQCRPKGDNSSADPALVSRVSVTGVFSMVFRFIPCSSWGRGLPGTRCLQWLHRYSSPSNPRRPHPPAHRKIPGMHLMPRSCWPQCRECSQWTLTRLPG